MKTALEQREISDYWKKIEPDKWFDPAFKDFVDREIIKVEPQGNRRS